MNIQKLASTAISFHTPDRQDKAHPQEIERRLARLTPQEREVMELLIAGDGTRAIAERLNLTPETVDLHRARLVCKMQAGTPSGLVRMVASLRAEQRGNVI